MEGLRFAGDLFNLDDQMDFEDEMNIGDLSSLKRGFRRDKLIPRSLFKDFQNEMAPEYSQPEYALNGSYQPEPAYGA